MPNSTLPPSALGAASHAAEPTGRLTASERDRAGAPDDLYCLRLICQLTDYDVASTTADDWARAARGIGDASRGPGLQDRPPRRQA